MKKWIFSVIAIAALSSVAIFASERFNQGELTLAQIANIEALSEEESTPDWTGPSYIYKCDGGGHRLLCKSVNSQPCKLSECF